jgi:hypothetical protein
MEEKNNVTMDKIVLEIAQIPQEHWGNLLQMIKLFQDSISPKPEKAIDPLEASLNMSKEERHRKNQAALALMRHWEETGDEQEDTETWEYLQKALEENPVSI